MFFRHSVTSSHPTTKPSRGWLRVGVSKPQLVLARTNAARNKVTTKTVSTAGGVERQSERANACPALFVFFLCFVCVGALSWGCARTRATAGSGCSALASSATVRAGLRLIPFIQDPAARRRVVAWCRAKCHQASGAVGVL